MQGHRCLGYTLSIHVTCECLWASQYWNGLDARSKAYAEWQEHVATCSKGQVSMDPNACLRRIDAPEDIDDDVNYAMDELQDWLAAGCAAPDWAKYPRGQRRFVVRYGWRKDMIMTNERARDE